MERTSCHVLQDGLSKRRWSKLDSHPTVGVSGPLLCGACASPVHVHVCCWGVCGRGRGGGRPCAEERLSLEEGAGLEGATLGWDLPGSLNHIGAAMGRLSGAWRVEREAQAGDLSASPFFDLLASLERLLHTWGCGRRPREGASSWPGTGSFFLLHGLAGPCFPVRVTEGPGCAVKASCPVGLGPGHTAGALGPLTSLFLLWFCLHSSGSTLCFSVLFFLPQSTGFFCLPPSSFLTVRCA